MQKNRKKLKNYKNNKKKLVIWNNLYKKKINKVK